MYNILAITPFTVGDIHSIGDPVFLYYILNGVAMIVKSPSYFSLIGAALVFGLIITVVQGMSSPSGAPNYRQTFFGMLAVMVMYGISPTSTKGGWTGTTVNIYDSYGGNPATKGTPMVVDNVPFGVAMVGSVVSYVGLAITEVMDLAFSGVGSADTGMLSSGFLSPLDAITKIRSATMSTAAFVNANGDTGDDVQKSWYNYFKECTFRGVDLGDKNAVAIMSGKGSAAAGSTGVDIFAAVEYKSKSYGTLLFLDKKKAGKYYTCEKASAKLKTRMNGDFKTNIFKDLMGVIYPSRVESSSAPRDTYTGAMAEIRVKGYLESLGFDQLTARDFITASVLLPIYGEAAKGKYGDALQTAKATMINQAIIQRNTQWAAEKSLFDTVSRPMMTFFEGFIYAVTPMVGVMMGLGAFGVKLAGKYLLILVMMTLWTPIMSIIHLFTLNSVKGKMAALTASAGSEMPSFYGLMSMDSELQNWLATAGMLAASVPALAIMLVMGGAVAASNMMGRMNSSQHINEKIASPDVVEPKAALTMDSMKHANPNMGVTSTGLGSLLPGLSRSNTNSNIIESSRTKMDQLSSGMKNDVMAAYSNLGLTSKGRQLQAEISKSLGSTTTDKTGYGNSITSGYDESKGDGRSSSDGKSNNFSTINTGSVDAGGNLKIGPSTPAGSASVSFSGKTGKGFRDTGTDQKSSDKNQSESRTQKRGDNSTRTMGNDAAIVDQIMSRAQDGTSESWEEKFANTMSESSSESYSSLLSEAKTHKEAQQKQESITSGHQVSGEVLAAELSDTPDSMASMEKEAKRTNSSKAVDRKQAGYAQNFDSKRARAAALYDVLSNNGTTQSAKVAYNAASDALGWGDSYGSAPGMEYDSNRSIGSPYQGDNGQGASANSTAPSYGSVQKQVNASSSERKEALTGVNPADAKTTGDDRVRSHHSGNSAKQDKLFGDDYARHGNNNINGVENHTGAKQWIKDVYNYDLPEEVVKGVEQGFNQFSDNAGHVYDVAQDGYEKMVQAYKSNPIITLTPKGEQAVDSVKDFFNQKKKLNDGRGGATEVRANSSAEVSTFQQPNIIKPFGAGENPFTPEVNNDSFRKKVGHIESGNGEHVDPSPGHSYAGTYQFNEGSAKKYLDKLGHTWNDYLKDSNIQEQVFNMEMDDYTKQLEAKNIPVNEMSLWGAHNMGVQGISEIFDSAENGTQLKQVRIDKIKGNLPNNRDGSERYEPTAENYIKHYGKTFKQ